MDSIFKFLFSNKLTGVLILFFAISMAVATFIENDFNTETAFALVYGAKWFEILLMFICANFIGNIAKYNLFSIQKAPIFVFHLAFIIIILGAGITRYRGYEALMTIKEKSAESTMVSYDSFLQVSAANSHFKQSFPQKKLLMSQLGFNDFSEKYNFNNDNINIKFKEYIPVSEEGLVPTSENGETFLHLVLSGNSSREDHYIKEGTSKSIYNINVSFNSLTDTVSDILIKEVNGEYKVQFIDTVSYFSMLENKSGKVPSDSLVDIKFLSLFNVSENPVVFKSIATDSKLAPVKILDNKQKNPPSSLVLSVQSGSEEKEVILYGGKGYVNPLKTIFINGIHLNLRYGSKPIELPFSVYLNDFTVERYPGSDSPSSFHSDIVIKDGDEEFPHKIFMNNVLDYKGYRLFQSAYLPDESGTILSVNKDLWGTVVTYIGYALMALGMAMSLIWKHSYFTSTKKRLHEI